MAPEKDNVSMLPISDSSLRCRAGTFTSRAHSISLSSPSSFVDGSDNSNVVLGYKGSPQTQRRSSLVQMSGSLSSSTRNPGPLYFPPPIGSSDSIGGSSLPERYPSFTTQEQRNSDDEFVLKSEQLGMCNDPYCTTCLSYKTQPESPLPEFHNAQYDGANGRAKRFALFGIMNLHSKYVQYWTKFFFLSFLIAIFIDPLFFFLITVQQTKKCIVIDWPMTYVVAAVRTATDGLFFLNMLLQFRLTYVAPESTAVGAGQLVAHPGKIAWNYLRGKFLLDFIIVMPLAQILIFCIIPQHLGTTGLYSVSHLLGAAIILQYIPKLYRLLQLLVGKTPTGFIFESAWCNFVINLLTFMLAGHIVGSFWYLFGLQRVTHCLRNACGNSNRECSVLRDCGRGSSQLSVDAWRDNANANACFQEDVVRYGIYLKAINLTCQYNPLTRYSYSVFWGFQQISTLAGNQVPAYNLDEVYFTMGIIGLGLSLFALLIGNMQNFLQAIGQRKLEMTLRRREVKKWMTHRRLPKDIRKRVQEAERLNWSTTRGVNEEVIFSNFPDDLQRDIRRHLFIFLKKVRLFPVMDESILDSIGERLKQRTYLGNSKILHHGGLVEKMVFIVSGEMQSIGEDDSLMRLSEGDVCGEELLTWCLKHSSLKPDGTRINMPLKGPISNRSVMCVTNVDTFTLSLADLEDVTSLYSRFCRRHRVLRAIWHESPFLKPHAARQIQVAWRNRRKRLQRLKISEEF